MIALIGFMGAGKSTLARVLGEKLDLPVYELDKLVYELTGLNNMQEIFAKGGEEYLRTSEFSVLERIANKPQGILDCGAGAVTYEPSLKLLKTIANKIILLDIPFDLSYERVGGDSTRPLFASKEDALLRYNTRIPLYHRIATDVILVNGQSVEDLALEAMEII